MTDKQEAKPTYKWSNRQEYSHNQIQTLGDKLTTPQIDNQQALHAYNLLQAVLHRSQTALVYFNDETKQMTLYCTPDDKLNFNISNQQLLLYKTISDSKNYFTYEGSITSLFGERGKRVKLTAYGNKNITVNYTKMFGQRVDNHFSSNYDRIALMTTWKNLKLADQIKIALCHEGRQNYLDFYQKYNQKHPLFSRQSQDIIKHSNLWALQTTYHYKFIKLNHKLGWDYGNHSHFMKIIANLNHSFKTSQNTKLGLQIQYGQLWGKNILKNDWLFRNLSHWPGSRSKNYTTARAQFKIEEYPYLSTVGLSPYFYTQVWGNLTNNQERQIKIGVEADYGFGVVSSSSRFKFDISLFRISLQKNGQAYGSLKFNF